MTVFCFLAYAHEGIAVETDEAIPQWTHVDAIPFDEMWADDALWIPMMLRGEAFDGRYIFDGEIMVDHAFREPPHLADIAADLPHI